MHKRISSRIYILTAFLIAAMAALAIACSSEGDSAPPVAPAPTSPPTAAPTAQPTTPPEPPTATPAPPPTPEPAPTEPPAPQAMEYPAAPDLLHTGGWVNSEPFTLDEMQEEGKVVLIDFWTYTCINCIRTLPYLREWHDKYADHGLVILGVHTPEFAFEHEYDNVVEAVGKFELEYPIVQDNEFGTWRAFNNRYWPAKYLIDHNGNIRYMHFGEGAYDETEMKIRDILTEAGFRCQRRSRKLRPRSCARRWRDGRDDRRESDPRTLRGIRKKLRRSYGAADAAVCEARRVLRSPRC